MTAVEVVQAGGPWVALLGVVLLGLRYILGGKLVPRSTLDVLAAQWEARLGESHTREQDWRTAYQRAAERADVQAGQLGELMTYAKTTDAIVRALPSGKD